MTKRVKRRERIQIELEGKKYVGERVIKGARKLDQYIVFEGRCLPDIKGYSPDQEDRLMLSIAKLMLAELISGSISAQPVSKYKLY